MCIIVLTKECAKGANDVVPFVQRVQVLSISNGQHWCLLERNNSSFHGNISKILYLVHIWHWESPPSNVLCHRFSICIFTDLRITVQTGQRSLSRDAFDLQSLRVVSNIFCRHLQERDHPPAPFLCAWGRGLEPTVQSSPEYLFLDQSWTLILVLVHAAYNSLLFLLDCELVSCCFSATDGSTDNNSNTFKYKSAKVQTINSIKQH